MRPWWVLAALVLAVAPSVSTAAGYDSLVSLEGGCLPWAGVEYHRVGARDVADRVWVAPSNEVVSDVIGRERARAAASTSRRSHRFRLEPALGMRIYTAVVLHESGGHPWAIGDNGVGGRGQGSYTFATEGEALRKARELIAQGHTNLDIGLGQVNTGNFAGYGLTLETAFDPCTNVRTGGMILAKSYYSAAEIAGYGPEALEMALRAYNTGHFYVGQKYADSVWRIAATLPAAVGATQAAPRKVTMR